MALIECHECREKISSEAERCPKCGAKPRGRFSWGAVILGGMVCAAIALWVWVG